ncbi:MULTISPECIES: hypothetical protein [Sinorhizobium]|uniref:hypothetical protein n=1 Tax=Sinorhizobium TaxID=28105 RepID=UPI000BE8E34F|nr:MULTISPECIES: hypothetical protein [Sinorhizobium]PDT50602.1 hypothetical protein CO664_25570 [Sinorhizobium sp. NG07B]POH33886.1 hypothetical protein ATY30_00755 [Sinorhizobium americanum]
MLSSFFIMDGLALIEAHLALAERHVADGARHVVLQVKSWPTLRAAATTPNLRGLLAVFEQSLAFHLFDRDRLIRDERMLAIRKL